MIEIEVNGSSGLVAALNNISLPVQLNNSTQISEIQITTGRATHVHLLISAVHQYYEWLGCVLTSFCGVSSHCWPCTGVQDPPGPPQALTRRTSSSY